MTTLPTPAPTADAHPRPRTTGLPRPVAVAAVALVAVLAACAPVRTVPPWPDGLPRRATGTPSVPPAGAVPPPAPVPAPVPVPVPVASPWPDDPSVRACTDDDVDLALGHGDAATGHRAQVVTATSTASDACALAGYPAVGFLAPDGRAFDVTVVHGSSFMATDPGPVRFVLPPGGGAVAVLGWDAIPTAGVDDLTVVVALGVGGAGTTVDLPLSSAAPQPDGGSTVPSELDVADGSEVEVTAWAPLGHTF